MNRNWGKEAQKIAAFTIDKCHYNAFRTSHLHCFIVINRISVSIQYVLITTFNQQLQYVLITTFNQQLQHELITTPAGQLQYN